MVSHVGLCPPQYNSSPKVYRWRRLRKCGTSPESQSPPAEWLEEDYKTTLTFNLFIDTLPLGAHCVRLCAHLHMQFLGECALVHVFFFPTCLSDSGGEKKKEKVTTDFGREQQHLPFKSRRNSNWSTDGLKNLLMWSCLCFTEPRPYNFHCF